MDSAKTKYVALTTYRRNGSAATTPVWIVPFLDGYACTTEAKSFKVGRIRERAAVSIVPSTFKGKALPGHSSLPCDARIASPEEYLAIEKLVRRKYWFLWHVAILPSEWWQRVRRGVEVENVGLIFIPHS